MEAGRSGIGIGSGGSWANANYIITNCICDGCGQYGIFIEDQSYLGGANITVTGCEVYGNAKHGAYMEGPCKDVKILSCGSSGNGADGICLEPGATSESIAVKNCVVTKNTGSGIHVNSGYGRFCICDNHTDANAVGLEVGEIELADCVLKNNTLLDDADVKASFTGNIGYVKRIALYDADKMPVVGTIVTLNNEGVTEISVPDNAHFAAVCFLGTTDVVRTCQILTTEVAL